MIDNRADDSGTYEGDCQVYQEQAGLFQALYYAGGVAEIPGKQQVETKSQSHRGKQVRPYRLFEKLQTS